MNLWESCHHVLTSGAATAASAYCGVISGSVQGVCFDEETEKTLKEEYSYNLRGIYKTVWEIKQRHLVEMAADRGAFIDQSQSFNVHIADPNFGKLTSLHFTAWRAGLKTGMYYLRTRAAAEAIKFTVCYYCKLYLNISYVVSTLSRREMVCGVVSGNQRRIDMYNKCCQLVY